MNNTLNKIRKPFIGMVATVVLGSFPIYTLAKQPEKETKPKTTENVPDLSIHSESAYLYDLSMNKIIYEKNADEVLPAASLTKVMTMYLASDALKSKKVKNNDPVTVSEKAWRRGGNRMFLEVGRRVPLGEIFKGIAIDNGNDASVAMAEDIAGSTDKFIKAMNKKAQNLGMVHTTFQSVDGYADGDIKDTSTAKDLGELAAHYIRDYPGNLAIHKISEYSFDTGRGVISQSNRNPFLKTYPGSDGLMAGGVEGSYNLIGTAQKDGIRLVVVTMKSATEKDRADDAKTLLNYGFNQYRKYTLGKRNAKITTIPVYKAKDVKKADILLKNDVELVLHRSHGDVVKRKLSLPEYLNASKGIQAGETVGKLTFYDGKKKIAESDLIVNKDIQSANWWEKCLDSLILAGQWVIHVLGRS